MDQHDGCGCIGYIIFIGILIGIGSCTESCEKSRNKNIKEDYSSPPSEMGRFTPSHDRGIFQLHIRGFTVRNGVGYLTLEDGELIKMKRTGNGRYSGLNYEAIQTYNEYGYGDGYRIIRHGRRRR